MTADPTAPVAILGGTFDPVHIAHLRAAIEVREQCGAREVRLMPSALPPHREAPGVDAATRAELVELAIESDPGLVCDRRELARSGPSYTIDSLRELRSELGERCPLLLILGCDALLGLPGWHRWRELLDYCHLVVTGRPGWTLPEQGELAAYLAERLIADAATLVQRPCGGVFLASMRELAVSATEIRGLLQSGRSVRFLVPDAVRARILSLGLYGSAD